MKTHIRLWFWDHVSQKDVVAGIKRFVIGAGDPALCSFATMVTTCGKVIVEIVMPPRNLLQFWDDLTEALHQTRAGCVIRMELTKSTPTLRCRIGRPEAIAETSRESSIA